MRSETDADTSKNMVSMKTVLVTVLITSILAIIIILLHYLDQSHIPYNLILTVAIFTTYPVKFSQNTKIQEFLNRKKSQKKLELNDYFLGLKESILKVRSRRVGGATYQVPVEVKSKRAQALAIRWLVDSARKRKDKHMSDKIFNELFDAYEKKGAAVKKREDVHKMAESNKAFAHFRW